MCNFVFMHSFTQQIEKYYLKHEQECFIGYKTRGEAERFISDKARIAGVLDGFKNDPRFIPILSVYLRKNFQNRCFISREIHDLKFRKMSV